MGLTRESIGLNTVDGGLDLEKASPDDKIIALAGNPNVGKSTVFNNLTGMNQHTGNWPGKTVATAVGRRACHGREYLFVDLPGTYSLMAHSAEEEVARDFICYGGADAVAVVCDATCLERNLNLVLQTLEISSRVVVCVNLMDEAKKKHIQVDLKAASKLLGVPVIGTSARSGKGLEEFMEAVKTVADAPQKPLQVSYLGPIEEAIALLEPQVRKKIGGALSSRWVCLKLLDDSAAISESLQEYLGVSILEDELIQRQLEKGLKLLDNSGISKEKLRDRMVSSIVMTAKKVAEQCVHFEKEDYNARDRKLDKILTNKWTGIPIMLLLLAFIFWLTITGANYPSSLLSTGLFWIEDRLMDAFNYFHAPLWLSGALVQGVYRVLAWVVAVMLPPMAIFFPLFTLLEDFGYLPRIAFNLDHQFKKACTCGKQALTMCMGFGCNAAGVVGCRIIDSPRERMIAILTNNFVPCNGRFPTLIAIITMFFAGVVSLPYQSFFSTAILMLVIVLGVMMTFWVSRLLSGTLLKGVPSSFTLELPPYRRPQIGKVIVRSIFDRTLFVLGRAAAVAAPAGLLIWVLANVQVGNTSLLLHCANFLDPFASLLGLDGIILMAFILGFPANEIVIPIIVMAYMATGSLTDMSDLTQLKSLLVDNGWTWLTAINTMLFSLMHWPCSTTCLTIKKETGSLKWTAISFLLPTVIGMLICFLFTSLVRLFGLV